MSELKHTKGEFIAGQIWADDNHVGSSVIEIHSEDLSTFIGTVSDRQVDTEEMEANGNLLAAAPSMLSALYAALEWIGNPEMHKALKQSVQNAIDKATK